MLGLSLNGDSYMAAEATHNSQHARKRHRARHHKSRLGCFSCKSRRVKCDEVRPVCGSCSSRGEPCVFPDPPATSLKPTSASRGRRDSPRSRSGSSPRPLRPYLESWETYTSRPAGVSAPANDDLDMDNLRAMQFFHLHTAQEMSLHPKRSMVWRRVIPRLAGKHRYLMHLLIALGGVHMITQRLRQRPGEDCDSDTVDLRLVMDHYQRGLQDFRKEVAKISNSNAEAVYAGSLLLVAFVYASLQVPELNPAWSSADPASVPYPPALNMQTLPPIDRPQVSWLHLIRGASTVIQDQWPVLKASCMRPMVLHFHGDEYWKDLPFDSSLSKLSYCSLLVQLFAQGALQAVADLRAFHTTLRLTGSNELYSTSVSPSDTSEVAVDGPSRAIDVLESIYSRVMSVLQCTISEQGSPDDSDIQYNLEEAAVLGWPILVPDVFIGLLESDELVGQAWGLSLAILAHFYVVNTLVGRWFLGAFKEEILRIQNFVSSLHDVELDRLLILPVKIATS
ncbi:sterol regulatory element-binding protein ECM22 [Aspergillus udagawae]|nr:sterol regulatory element-binding protein ECM22 [Aspergillus udagawae]